MGVRSLGQHQESSEGTRSLGCNLSGYYLSGSHLGGYPQRVPSAFAGFPAPQAWTDRTPVNWGATTSLGGIRGQSVGTAGSLGLGSGQGQRVDVGAAALPGSQGRA